MTQPQSPWKSGDLVECLSGPGELTSQTLTPLRICDKEMWLPVTMINHVNEHLHVLSTNLLKYYHIPDVQCS